MMCIYQTGVRYKCLRPSEQLTQQTDGSVGVKLWVAVVDSNRIMRDYRWFVKGIDMSSSQTQPCPRIQPILSHQNGTEGYDREYFKTPLRDSGNHLCHW